MTDSPLRPHRAPALLGAAYALVAVVTFGHAAADWKRKYPQNADAAVVAAYTGMAAAIVWPLYWSWYAFERDAMSLEKP